MIYIYLSNYNLYSVNPLPPPHSFVPVPCAFMLHFIHFLKVSVMGQRKQITELCKEIQ